MKRDKEKKERRIPQQRLSGNGSPLSSSDPGPLSDVQPHELIFGIISLIDLLIGLGEHELNVAWVGHVWVDLLDIVRFEK